MSTFDTKNRRDAARVLALICVLGLVVAAALWWLLREPNEKRYTAVFSGVVGLYEDNDVRVLGVRVGTVDKITPRGDRVEVELLVDRTVEVPADAKAVIVAPSLVSDRYVQLTPAYTGGAVMAVGAVIPRERTATPLEVDDLYASLARVSETLGPNGVNKDGALSDLLIALSKNLDGNGQAVNDTVTQLGKLSSTLSGNSDDLFATITQLQKFTSTLAANDEHVRTFTTELAEASEFLAGERGNLAAAVDQLGIALGSVQKFINDNRGHLKSNVDKLASVTQVLVDQRAALAETLDIAPLALSNVINTYNASSGTLDARANLNELTQPPIVTVCKLVRQGTAQPLPQTLADLCDQLAPVVQGAVPLPSPAQVIEGMRTGKLPTLPLPIAGDAYSLGGR
ncbi:MCE family protein [Actinokineospora globicatena]|uniref:ABC transporter substrate-binding protein n=1 Tax=Actinokineospora globicatena TaxID=103729 RepID=A0A9W6QTI3_9PSEU|nr:MCE family protein [Actinokineospora globicatena]MCP2301807.1 virulence factor Mce family protein [Actinokineospora globicatena]GLW76535.1 ABC transporter substrate-binding protein [Actinokineospora globicatena]GLW83369.1 ABC transporter substrate-binding protein [Actinokineospora globicatena]GLW94648.1 ABC transporter substrate-binding protein [Actinokineospora globicatena]